MQAMVPWRIAPPASLESMNLLLAPTARTASVCHAQQGPFSATGALSLPTAQEPAPLGRIARASAPTPPTSSAGRARRGVREVCGLLVSVRVRSVYNRITGPSRATSLTAPQVPTKRRRAPTPPTSCARRARLAPTASGTCRSRTAPLPATSGRTRRRRARTRRTGCAPGAPRGVSAWTAWRRRLATTRRAPRERTRRRRAPTPRTSCARRALLPRTVWGVCTSPTAPCRATRARTRRPRARTRRIACAPGAASSSSARTGCATTRAGRGARGSCTRRRPARM